MTHLWIMRYRGMINHGLLRFYCISYKGSLCKKVKMLKDYNQTERNSVFNTIYKTNPGVDGTSFLT